MKYALKRPIKVGDAPEITSLTLREELSAGDLRGLKLRSLASPLDMSVDDMLKIVGRLSGRSDPEMSRLSPEDFGALGEIIADFFSSGSSPTETSSASTTPAAPSAS